jgi:DNA-binding PadR family transcriptional regulator
VISLKESLRPHAEERMVRAFLDLVILRMLSYRSMTGYQIDKFILQIFKVTLGANIIYTKLASLERDGLAICNGSRHQRGRKYEITMKGSLLLNGKVVEAIQYSANRLLSFKLPKL